MTDNNIQKTVTQIRDEFIKTFGNQEWLYNVTVYNSHPNTGVRTIEVQVHYNPAMVMKELLTFSQSVGCDLKLINKSYS